MPERAVVGCPVSRQRRMVTHDESASSRPTMDACPPKVECKCVVDPQAWDIVVETYARCIQVAPEAFDSDRLRNLTRGEWRRIGIPGDHVNAVDGAPIPGPPLVKLRRGGGCCRTCGKGARGVGRHRSRRASDHGVGRRRRLGRASRFAGPLARVGDREAVAACLCDVDRCVDGARWYLGQIERQLTGSDGKQRGPLPGPVSNIASWNYPMSVQVHAELVQALTG